MALKRTRNEGLSGAVCTHLVWGHKLLTKWQKTLPFSWPWQKLPPKQQILKFHANWLNLKEKLKNARTPRRCPPSDPLKGCNANTSQQGETKHSVSFLQEPAPQVKRSFLFP